MPGDLLVTNARIHTVEPGAPVAEALAVRRGRIAAVGRAAEVLSLAGRGSRVVDLGGRTILPGLIDAHLHLLEYALSLERVDLVGAASIGEALARVRAGLSRLQPGEWLLGSGWDRHVWGQVPTHQDLDVVSPANPVALASKDLHTLWVNSRALREARLGRGTVSPPGGEIVRDSETGEPTGVLLENACRLVSEAVPPPPPDRCVVALARALAIAAGKGLTGLQTFEGEPTLAALRRLEARGDLRLRVCCHLRRESLPEVARVGVRTGAGSARLRTGHLKLFLDGALGSQTAWMLAPYSGTDQVGIPTLTRDELRELVLAGATAGIAPAVHAIGDAANRLALDVFAETADAWRGAGLRPRIEHAQLLGPGDAARFGRLGVVASMQPSHAPSDWPTAERLWAGRTGGAYAWRSLLDAGAPLAFGSDCPVEPLDPLPGIHAAVTRQTADGRPAGGWHPEQRLSPLEALRAYTLGAAYSSGEEASRGSLAPGKLADFVVLDRDPLAGPPEAWLRARVEATVVGGEVVHGGSEGL